MSRHADAAWCRPPGTPTPTRTLTPAHPSSPTHPLPRASSPPPPPGLLKSIKRIRDEFEASPPMDATGRRLDLGSCRVKEILLEYDADTPAHLAVVSGDGSRQPLPPQPPGGPAGVHAMRSRLACCRRLGVGWQRHAPAGLLAHHALALLGAAVAGSTPPSCLPPQQGRCSGWQHPTELPALAAVPADMWVFMLLAAPPPPPTTTTTPPATRTAPTWLRRRRPEATAFLV